VFSKTPPESDMEELIEYYRQETGKNAIESVNNSTGDGSVDYFTDDFVYWMKDLLKEYEQMLGRTLREDY
jgi:hypothetical protein